MKLTQRLALLVFGIAPLLGISALAQTDTGQFKFEAASVKPNRSSDAAGLGADYDGVRAVAINTPLITLVRQAYQVQDFQIVGAASWVTSDRFDVVATLPAPGSQPLPRDSGTMMMRSLLADRFKLAIHHETRELPVYALVMARADGKPGPTFHQPAVDCYARLRRAPLRPDAPPAPLPAGFLCGGMRAGAGQLSGRMAAMRQLTEFLSPQVGRVVIDKTGVTVAPDVLRGAAPSSSADATTSIYTALQEQLGLTLDAQRGAVDVLVIDHVEQPTAD
jgi:uncharacterized protein (TIGR03435 family)